MPNRTETTNLAPTLESVLCCPVCGATLQTNEVVAGCRNCSFTFSVQDGAYDLRVIDQSVSRLPMNILERMLLDAQQHDWRAALHDSLRRIDPTLYRAMTDDFRSAWRLLAPIEPGERVLILEAGPSNLLPQLAAAGIEGIDLLGSLPGARFMSLRMRECGLKDALVGVTFDQLNLPIRTSSVDAALVDNVAGWWPSLVVDPRRLERLILECRRVIRPGGSLTLLFDNAIGFDHLAYPLIGRVRAPVYVRAPPHRREEPKRLPGFRFGLVRHYLHQAGFGSYQAYAVLPFAETPLYLVPMNDLSLFGRTLRRLVHGYDWSLHARHRQLGVIAELIGVAAYGLQLLPGTALFRQVVPSICVVATVGTD